jgi:hypothetical protein
MNLEHDSYAEGVVYRPGLDRLQEAVISSHFMHELCCDHRLTLYDDELFSAKAVTIATSTLTEQLIPVLLRASEAFARNRALAAKRRAVANRTRYGVDDPRNVGLAEFITEVMFDRQFRRSPRETCSRQVLRGKVAQRIADGAPIEMVIPALPYKFSCPLKTRGQLPDLAEANFLLGLYEIAAAIEALYREARHDLTGSMARFTVISDGSRFNRLVNEPDSIVETYRQNLTRWISWLHLDAYVELLDYHALLRDRLPQSAREAKEGLRQEALQRYAEIMWPVFDTHNVPAMLEAAARIDPDPEGANPQGRFVSLFKSLVFTVNYRALERFKTLSTERFCALYRELTGHIFEPFAILSVSELRRVANEAEDTRFSAAPAAKEYLRQAMLGEVWSAAIAYIAEIKSDRELATEPISACLPNHLRWTIHAKPGQLGLMTAAALGKPVQAWAGSAVFKRVGLRGIRLCTLPVLALEGAGAIPVEIDESGDALAPVGQPLFYIYPDVAFDGVDDFVTGLASRLVRKRVR